MLPERVTVAAISSEIEPAHKWARREGVCLEALLSEKLVRAVFQRAGSDEKFFLQGFFDGYKAFPPVWEWCDSNWANGGRRELSPESARTPYGGSMFLDNGTKAVICAPFNRLAFSVHGGPHSNWGELSHWMSAGQGFVQATTIADMLNVIARDFRFTSGRLA